MISGIFKLGVRADDHHRRIEAKVGLNRVAVLMLLGFSVWGGAYYAMGSVTLAFVAMCLAGASLLFAMLHAAVGHAPSYGVGLSLLLAVGPLAFAVLAGSWQASCGCLVWMILSPIVAYYYLSSRAGWAFMGLVAALAILFVVLQVTMPHLALASGAVPAVGGLSLLVANLLATGATVFLFINSLMQGYATARQEVLIKSAEIIGAYDDLNVQKEALKQNLEEMQTQQEELRRVETHLRASQQQMQELNANLEIRVEERTRELRATMDNLKNTQAKMVESEKMATLGNLVAGVAHEINTPVGIAVTAASHLQHTMQQFTETVNTGQIRKSDIARVVSEGTEASDIILKNLERASELVQSFKKVAVNQSTERVEEFNLRGYTEEIIMSLRPTLRKTKLEVLNELPDITLLGLPSAFSQIIINFITNSIRYGYEDNTPGTLRLWAETEDDKICIHYSDDGKGIPPENLPKIFDPFFTTGRTKGGSGLGLNIVYNLVTQKMEGDIDVESVFGEGTTFHLTLPLRLTASTA